jgi:hypothetical protein
MVVKSSGKLDAHIFIYYTVVRLGGVGHEKNVSTQKKTEKRRARFQKKNEYKKRQKSFATASL